MSPFPNNSWLLDGPNLESFEEVMEGEKSENYIGNFEENII